MMLKFVTTLRASRKPRGSRPAGLFAEPQASRALAGLAVPLIPGSTVIDLHRTPGGGWPPFELLAGAALLGMSLLWFRRSRRGAAGEEAKAAPSAPAETPTVPPQRRLSVPLRIRGLLLLNLRATDGMEQIETAPPLGPRDSVIRSVEAVVPGLALDASGRGEVAADEYRLSVDLGPHDPVRAAVASAEGDTGIELLRGLVQSQGWRAYAARAGVFIEPDALKLFALPDAMPARGRP